LDDPNQPYRVCEGCYRRLISHSLRPLEWYNLSSVHGRLNDYLDEDHYTEEDGAALDPAEEVVDAGLFLCPRLEEVASSPEELLTYSLTRQEIREEELSAMRRHSPEDLCRVLSVRLENTSNIELARRMFDLIGLTLGPQGAAVLDENWERFALTHAFGALALAASRCFPLEEGHAKVTDVLSRMDRGQRSINKGFLSGFETDLSLNWLEENVQGPIHESWGSLAASSRFDWARAKKWLSLGRPLSLVALDALHFCASRGREPALLNPPSVEEFRATLQDYLAKDSVPRVRRQVSALLELGERLARPASL
jgi:hypothetical protein